MEYKIDKTQIIHFDEGITELELQPHFKMGFTITIEVAKVYKNKLPLVFLGRLKVFDTDIQLFSCIIQSRVMVTFVYEEYPLNQLKAMIEEILRRQHEQWIELTTGSDLVSLFPSDNHVKLGALVSHSNQIIEAGRRVHLLQ